MKLTRRKMLIAGSLAALPPLVIGGRALASSPEDTIVRYLRSATGNRTISEANLYQFAERFAAVHKKLFGSKFEAAMVIMDNGWSTALLPDDRRQAYEAFERSLLTEFLFSTDFFTTAGRDFEKMAYVDYADPYASGCRNPLAQFDMEA